MGLDIYVRFCDDLDAEIKKQEQAEIQSAKHWNFNGKNYNELTQEEKDNARLLDKQLYESLGLDEWGSSKLIMGIQKEVSKIDADHMFKLDYFRSSYNGGGINNVMRTKGIYGLYEIFGKTNSDEYHFRPNWDESLIRVNEAIDKFSKHINSDAGRFLVSEVNPLWNYGAKNEKEAMDIFIEKLNIPGRSDDFSSFTDSNGEFYMKGINVRAIITKKYEPDTSGNPILGIINQPKVFIIYDKPESDGKEDWYLTALRIVRESIEYVLSQPNKDKYFLNWSA